MQSSLTPDKKEDSTNDFMKNESQEPKGEWNGWGNRLEGERRKAAPWNRANNMPESTGYLPSLTTAAVSSGDAAKRRHGCDNNTEDVERWISDALNDLDAAIREYAPIAVVGLMSGGNDSLPACYVASLHPAFSGILHVNTGIGIEGTRQQRLRVRGNGAISCGEETST